MRGFPPSCICHVHPPRSILNARRLSDARSHRRAIRLPTPGINICLGWKPHVTHR